jgi:hypothetical protein
MYGYLPLVSCLLHAASAQKNILSGATLFAGPKSPIVDAGYAQFQGKNDANTQSENYFGKVLFVILQHFSANSPSY